MLDYQIDMQKRIIMESLSALKRNVYDQKQEVEARIRNYEEEVRRSALQFDRIEFVRLQKLNTINENYYNRLVKVS